jgi:F-type H+-transporting ATPase subunit a
VEEEAVAHGAEGGLTFHPLDQFMLRPLFGGAEEGTLYNPSFFSITNATLWMALAVLAIFVLFVLGTAKRSVVPGRAQSMAELVYSFVHKMVEDVAGHDGVRYFPYIFTLFLFILFVNFLGLIPTSFTATSHIAVTAILGFGVFLAVTILGFVLNGTKFLGLFWMKDAPLFLRPIIAVIELISYFVRPVSHSIRLGGNIMAGHTVLKVFAGFAQVAAISPFAILGIAAIYGIEILVAGIQAYVFTILTCVYLKDALHPGH